MGIYLGEALSMQGRSDNLVLSGATMPRPVVGKTVSVRISFWDPPQHAIARALSVSSGQRPFIVLIP